jgi:hypothetical protein
MITPTIVNLARLQRQKAYFDREGYPTAQMQIHWQKTMEAIEAAFASINETITEIATTQDGLADAQAALEVTQTDLAAAQADLVATQATLTTAVADIAAAQADIITVQDDVTGLQTTIPVLASGTYTPTLTNDSNVAASTAYTCCYLRVGSVVHVSGRVDIDATALGDTFLSMSLPIASNLASAEELAGTFVDDTGTVSGSAKARPASDDALFRVGVNTTANTGYWFTFTYRVI